eukprot:CAMPEP_0168625624 /NCGR_PEP_ID=MMETSP0449_2-20121227/10132_1 /TAXON_ID=1082188 /ORGANISM="Strombidium rassoulzadegani, Strain ras09" /LENGTH=45 /DNA_ID= /DNA_START= /DNA_END= /DNA_ORIENTATION=
MVKIDLIGKKSKFLSNVSESIEGNFSALSNVEGATREVRPSDDLV